MDYIGIIDQHLAPKALSGRTGMDRLNTARNGLKHNGVRPSPADVESLRASLTVFLDDNVPLIFGIGFDEISMARVVTVEKARNQLLEAEKLIASGDHVSAIEACSIAFRQVIGAYHRLNPPPFKKAAFRVRPGSRGDARQHALFEYVGQIADALNDLQGRVDLLTLEVDPAKANRFRRITPRVAFTGDGESHLTWVSDYSKLTADDARFCYSTVIGAALAFQRRFSQ